MTMQSHNYSLGKWVSRQRSHHKNEWLSMERTRLLIDADFDFKGNTLLEAVYLVFLLLSKLDSHHFI